MAWIEDHLMLVILAVLAIIIFVFLFKLALRAALIFGVIAIIAIFIFGVSPNQMMDLGKQGVNSASTAYEKTIEPVFKKEMDDAKHVEKKDGSFVIQSKSVKITGKDGDKDAKVVYKGKTYDVDMNVIQPLREQIHTTKQ
ncbi:hypothetical protein [Fictibacillus terranigra]|uniref:Uncharacterized protein n=1 Tax=Fictibacillus terranigra TaxID=3058424 RepID=A0ABT8E8Q3_9BACL|nr:hypothetical protein [Fictibacillus sp. CENA-BCM004]MDN4074293.1 hypothetical protein [Fictibacillus sp. CENA-BCM004]